MVSIIWYLKNIIGLELIKKRIEIIWLLKRQSTYIFLKKGRTIGEVSHFKSSIVLFYLQKGLCSASPAHSLSGIVLGFACAFPFRDCARCAVHSLSGIVLAALRIPFQGLCSASPAHSHLARREGPCKNWKM